MAGTPSPFNEIAPIQLHLSAGAFGTGSDEKLIALSAGAGAKVGDSIFRKCVNGCASSPGGGLMLDRSLRYSGTRTSTLRRNAMRVAAPCGSEPDAAVCRALNCCCTSGGQPAERCVILSTVWRNVSA